MGITWLVFVYLIVIISLGLWFYFVIDKVIIKPDDPANKAYRVYTKPKPKLKEKNP